jgi:hypothetical protein
MGERRYSSYTFTTSALDGGEWSASRSGRVLLPGKGSPVPIVQETGWAPEPVWTQRLEKKSSCLCRGSNLDRQGRPVRRQTLYWLSYPNSSFLRRRTIIMNHRQQLLTYTKCTRTPDQCRLVQHLVPQYITMIAFFTVRKPVQLHAMQAPKERGGKAPIHSLLRHHAPVTLYLLERTAVPIG